MISPIANGALVARLLGKGGYCVTSRKFGIVCRIDRPDWKEHMARAHSPWSIDDGMAWVNCLGDVGAEDHYRRCYSKDKHELGEGAKLFPKSGETTTGYMGIKK